MRGGGLEGGGLLKQGRGASTRRRRRGESLIKVRPDR
jgi:hypothetical protein